MLDIPGPPESKEYKVFCKKVRYATCIVEMTPVVISIFFHVVSFDTAFQKSGWAGAPPRPPPGFDATDICMYIIIYTGYHFTIKEIDVNSGAALKKGKIIMINK